MGDPDIAPRRRHKGSIAMIRRYRCPKCRWSGDELDALYRGVLRCLLCDRAVVRDLRPAWQRWRDATREAVAATVARFAIWRRDGL